MSWISKNYEKVAIGGSAVVALALVAIIFKNKGVIDEVSVIPSVKKEEDVSVAALPMVMEAKDSLTFEHIIKESEVEGRKVNLFTGISLFAKKSDAKNPVDLHSSKEVHPGVPNGWWLENGIDPGFSDAPSIDSDGDGFSNIEEFHAKTNPQDMKSHPNLLSKLAVKGVKTNQVHLRPQDFGGGKYVFKLQTRAGRAINKMGGKPIKAGGKIIFLNDMMKSRFQFIEATQEEMQKNGIKQNVKFWIIADLKPNKVGTKYKINRHGDPGIRDSTVEFTLDALKEKGKPFKVEEKMSFALPFDPEAKEKPYLVKDISLTKKKVLVEYTDQQGKKHSQTLNF